MSRIIVNVLMPLGLCGLLFGCGKLEAEKPSGPAGELIGKWKMVSAGGVSKDTPNSKMKDVTYNFTESLMVMKIDGKLAVTASYEADVSKKPYRLIIRPKLGPEKKEVVQEFEIDGDTLKLGTGDKLEVLKRISE